MICSSIYITKAQIVTDQDDFYNMVISGQVADEENPFEFLKKINQIEATYGRDRAKEIRFGPRSLDIDIEIFGIVYWIGSRSSELIIAPLSNVTHIIGYNKC